MAKQHAEISASGADTWIRCPAAVQAQRGLPRKSSKYSDEGNAAHFVASWCLQNNADAEACLGREVALWAHAESESHGECWSEDVSVEMDVGARFDVSDEMVENVQLYLDTVRTYAKSGRLFVEVRVPLSHITTEPDAEGTSDALILTHDYKEIIVIDLKYGKGKAVYAEDNHQLQIYALGALEWLDIAGLSDNVERVRLVICQPRKMDAPSEWDLSVEDLRKFGVRANLSAVTGLTSENPVYNPGEKQCQWCRAKASCAAAQRQVIGTVIDDFDVVGNDQPRTEMLLEISKIQLFKADSARLGWLMTQLPFIEDWCVAVRQHVEDALLDGQEVPGFKVVKGRQGNRKWTDLSAVEAAFKSLKLKVDEIFKKTLISPAQAEKLLKKTPAKWGKVEPLITQDEGGPTVVPEKDPRPVYSLKHVADEFDNLDDEEEPLA